MDLRKVEELANRIQTHLFRNGRGMSTGLMKTHFKGSGLTFKEHQVYNYGDDVKFIDWKILARLGQPYVRTFEEERNVEIVALIDATPTMSYGYKGVSKFQAALEICCLLLLVCQKTGDTVQPVIVSDTFIPLPPSSGKEGMVELIGTLIKKGFLDSEGRVRLDRPLSFQKDIKKNEAHFMGLLRRHKEIILLSDFKNFLPESLLNKGLFKKNVHAYQILSPLDEMERLPFSILAFNDLKHTSTKISNFSIASRKLETKNEKRIGGKKIKPLRLDQPYLDIFIKDLK